MLGAKTNSFVYKNIIKPILFLFDPETIHELFLKLGNMLSKNSISKNTLKKIFSYESTSLKQILFDIEFNNPVGLSAGFDYNGEIAGISDAVGFGFESIGTVTYSSYAGNPKPRLVRLPRSKSILVNKGFKNKGIKAISNSILEKKNLSQTLGISIGATNSKDCSTSVAQIQDIVNSIKYLINTPTFNLLKYIEINVSCPNVLGSGALTNPNDFRSLMEKFSHLKLNKPIFVKFPLEIKWEDAEILLKIMIDYKVSAVIVSNLLKSRETEYVSKEDIERVKEFKGNFSGKPTEELSNILIEKIFKNFGKQIKIIGVGGIFSASDAYIKIKKGASLVQLITGMIYQGPQLIGEINQGLDEFLHSDGYTNISEAVGKGVT